MRIVVNNSGEYKDMINSYYGLEAHDDGSETDVLFQGYATSRDGVVKEKYRNFEKRAYLNLEAPCSFTSTQSSVDEQMYFTHVYSICPHTCDWLNGKGITKFTPIPFPFSAGFMVNTDAEKKYDAMYMGTLMNGEHIGIIDVLKNFNYIHTSLFNRRQPYRPTHVKIPSYKKLDLLARSRVSVAVNMAPIGTAHIKSITSYDDWASNSAFSHLKDGYIPQFKPRVIESMICKTLVLVRRDWWNVIDKWFVPEKHFVYWDDLDDLKVKIKDVCENYAKYAPIVEEAYKKVMEYEINRIYEGIICKQKQG